MQIVINHLTRLQPGYICTAGLDLATGKAVRPVLQRNITAAFLATKNGYFGIGEKLDLGRVQYVGNAPEVEDYRFEPGGVKRLGQMPAPEFWQLLRTSAKPMLRDIFGAEMIRQGKLP
jgi:hypothetical protein